MSEDKLVLGQYRDEMQHNLITVLRLNRYDLKFMVNINQRYIIPGKPLSLNQNDLYEKIVHKYRKQLKKLGVNYRDIIELPWREGVVSPEELNSKTYFKLIEVDGKVNMELYFNFNKAQIDEMRSLVNDDKNSHIKRGYSRGAGFGNGTKYDFTWFKEDKKWAGPFNVYLFREVYYFAKKHNVEIDNTVANLVSKMSKIGSREEWTPRVVISNNRMYVCHVADTMLPFLEDIDMADLSVQNVERLVKMGLAAPKEFAHIGEYINSVSPNVGHDVHTEEDVNRLKRYLKESKRKALFYASGGWMPAEANKTGAYKELMSMPVPDELAEWDDHIIRIDKNNVRDYDLDKLFESGYNTLIITSPIANLFRGQDKVGQFALKADKIIYVSLAGRT